MSAVDCHKRLHRYGYIRMNSLPRVTLEEHEWLTKNKPGIAGFTRTMRYADNMWMNDFDRPSEAQRPTVREMWVGARSLECINLEGQEDDDRYIFAGESGESRRRLNDLEREDQAELTDLVTLLYHDPKTGRPMIEDPDTGELRPVRAGDLVTIVRGSNDNLDSLFMDESDDPRQQNDWGAEGTDHKWSGRFRANTETEYKYLHNSRHAQPNSSDALPDGIRWNPDDLTIRRLAQAMFEKLLETRPELEDQRLKYTDQAEEKIRRMMADFQMDGSTGTIVSGYFVSKSEFFGTIEENLLRPRPTKKAAPNAVDWNKVRLPYQKARRTRALAALTCQS